MADFGLSDTSIALIQDILKKHSEVEQAIIYGSRAKGNYREGSDIDLTLKGERLTHSILSEIWSELDDSYSPYLFDLSIYSRLNNPDLINHIDRVGKIFYQKETA